MRSIDLPATSDRKRIKSEPVTLQEVRRSFRLPTADGGTRSLLGQVRAGWSRLKSATVSFIGSFCLW